MNKNLNVTIKVLENVDCKYPDAKIYIEEDLKEKTSQPKRQLTFSLSFLSKQTSTFSCINYFVLESIQVRYLDTYGKA